MRKIITMLLIALMAATTISAQRKQQVNTPTNVIKTLNFLCDTYGQKASQVYSVNKNPNTGIIESKEVITYFVCKKTDPHLTTIADIFHKDEPVSYQLMHIANGSRDMFRISVATDNAVKYINIRTRTTQNMWYMAVKNPENPQLRDVYAIVWENKGDPENVEGMIYMITSLRPDIYEKDMERIQTKTFTLDGRMGDDISDSLYVFYVADTYDELNRITMMTDSYEQLKYIQTNGKILLMPVSNDRRFGVTIDTDKRMGGRIRTVMPDGSLCKLWTNIDIVPGETYHITTHNSYYTPDSDYERRVGLYSGKSMFTGHDNDDVELTGGYNDTIVADTVANWDVDEYEDFEEAVSGNPFDKLTPAQRVEVERIGKMGDNVMGQIKALCEGMGNRIKLIKKQKSELTKRDALASLDKDFDELIKLNTKFDKFATELLNTAIDYGVPKSKIAEGYKELLEELSKQNKMFNELYKHVGRLSKKATKCQKHINSLMEKYMNEMSKLLK